MLSFFFRTLGAFDIPDDWEFIFSSIRTESECTDYKLQISRLIHGGTGVLVCASRRKLGYDCLTTHRLSLEQVTLLPYSRPKQEREHHAKPRGIFDFSKFEDSS